MDKNVAYLFKTLLQLQMLSCLNISKYNGPLSKVSCKNELFKYIRF